MKTIIQIETLKELNVGGIIIFEQGEILNVKKYLDRVFLKTKTKSIMIPKGYYKKIKD